MAAGISISQDLRTGNGHAKPLLPPERREWRLQRFSPPWRRSIASLTACSPELEDLAESFPALLFAFVSGFADAAATSRACCMVIDGACLKDVAHSIGLPLWLRRLPPEAFSAPLPRLPTDADYALRIANHLPRDAGSARQWLADLSTAATAAGPSFALWCARHIRPGLLAEDAVMMLGAWAWFSQTPGHLGHTLLRRPWSPEMSARRALGCTPGAAGSVSSMRWAWA